MKLSTLLLTLPLAATLLSSCKKDSDTLTGSVGVHFDAQANGNSFALGRAVTKSDGQSFTPTAFKYYVSNVRLLRADGSDYAVPESYYLIDAAKPLTAQLSLPSIPLGEYTGISFLAGVDAARNSAGAQTGALDAGQGMFWDWNQGYIYSKLEGSSPDSPTGAITFHIGGVPNIRPITISFGTAKLAVGDHGESSIHIPVNPLAMFESSNAANRISFATTYRVMSPTGISNTMADNIAAGMFLAAHVHNH
ncbi:hypothetical protein GCM10023185_36050 [Hymenobacter saemangeumensis]|uniref:Copper-binding protein MbnP-like domain-containing protein n=1 Tax=Hymenobacter saemangeumensis TaxID=1084522 RepID=A0ABP8IQU9_9BACT